MINREIMKKITLFILFFSLGYFFRYYAERQRISYMKIEEVVNKPQVEAISGNDQFITYIDFEDGFFSKANVTIRPGDYLAVTNKSSEVQMWLVSTVSALMTPRGYAEGERLQTTLNEVGRFIVTEKISKAVLEVNVLPKD